MLESFVNKELLELVVKTGALEKGYFKLSSGLLSEYYLQCAKLFVDPEIGNLVANGISRRVVASGIDIDMVVSPAIGGIIVGYEVARWLGRSHIFFERVEGKFTLRRGFEIPRANNSEVTKVLLVEDVITTGKSCMEILPLIEEMGAKVVAAACVFNRSGGEYLGSSDSTKVANEDRVPIISLEEITITNYTEDNIPIHLRGQIPKKAGSNFLAGEKVKV